MSKVSLTYKGSKENIDVNVTKRIPGYVLVTINRAEDSEQIAEFLIPRGKEVNRLVSSIRFICDLMEDRGIR